MLAGAGSGKTRTIVYRVAYLIERGVHPDNILLVTFTNKAAKEMLFRTEELLGQFPKGLWGGTFHHIANLLLRKYAKHIGFNHNFTILDQEDSKDLISVCVKTLQIDPKRTRFPSTSVIQGLISLANNTNLPVSEIISDFKPEFMRIQTDVERVAREYQTRKLRNNAMDFDDLLGNLRKLLREHPDVRQRLGQQFKYIMVDEYQDTNHIQADIVKLLAEVHRNILVVGDDAQSIYSFRGADIANILDFPKQWPDCMTYRLETNYRSTQPVLDVANEVIRHNTAQFVKKLRHIKTGDMRPVVAPAANDEQEAEFIAQKILELRDEGVSLNDMAVLFRAAFHSQALEFELTRRDIPYEFRGGQRFFDRAHIKDVLSYLKLVNNPRDEVAFLRVLKLQVGIGAQTAGAIFDQLQTTLATEEDRHPLEFIFESFQVPGRAEKGWRNFQSTLTALISERESEPETLIRLVMDSDYQDYLRHQYIDADDRLQDLEQLAKFSGKYRSLVNFLAEISLQEDFGVAGAAVDTATEEKVVLTTVHQAKGLEWRAVFVMHLSDLYFPSPRSAAEEGGMEEERRLFYVAVTRAQEYLFLTYAMSTGYRSMSMQLSQPSPFLKEIPERLLETYEISEGESSALDAVEDPDSIIELDDDGAPRGLLDRVLKSNQEKKQRRKGNHLPW